MHTVYQEIIHVCERSMFLEFLGQDCPQKNLHYHKFQCFESSYNLTPHKIMFWPPQKKTCKSFVIHVHVPSTRLY